MTRLTRPLAPGEPLTLWELGTTAEERFDVADQPMKGEMDPFFFLTKVKNFIPHEYPCRTEFAAAFRGRRPEVRGRFERVRWWLPFGSPRLDLSGFWFRPTRLATWARTLLVAEEAGPARLRLRTPGGAVLWLGGAEAGWMAPYTRNLEGEAEFAVTLAAGPNEILVFFDDLAERDARYWVELALLSGPACTNAVDVPVPEAEAIERILEGARFDRAHYLGGPVRLLLPEPLPVAARAEVSVEGDFMSVERVRRGFDLPAGATVLDLGPSEDFPADFRHFDVTLDAGGFRAMRRYGVEIVHVARQGEPAPDLAARVAQALDEVALHAEEDTVRAFARLATGRAGAETEAMIAGMLPAIEDCHDCADFVLVPLLWARIVWGGALSAPLRDRIDAATLGYRYWMDEAGNDVQWFFSENHALLFHTAAYLAGTLHPAATFRRSGRTGAAQAEAGRARVLAWLDHFEAWEMAEFNSAPYFPIDLKGLTALAALAPDEGIRARAAAGVARLLEIVARSAHHGMLTGAQGRSYEHTLRASRSLELSGIARLLWGRGWHGRRFHCLPQLAVLIRDHGFRPDPALAALAGLAEGEEEWRFAQGQDRFASLHHAKTPDWAMGTAAGYRWGDWGYQETVLHLRLGRSPEAQVWINHPGEVILSGYARPSFWGGCGTVPRVQQYRGLALVEFAVHDGQPPFTHAWFPAECFDETRVAGTDAFARAGRGCLLLRGSAPFEAVAAGPTAGAELRLPGPRCRWLVRLGTDGDLAAFAARHAALSVTEGADGARIVEDAAYGRVVFHADARVEAEGRLLVPKDWPVRGEAVRLA